MPIQSTYFADVAKMMKTFTISKGLPSPTIYQYNQIFYAKAEGCDFENLTFNGIELLCLGEKIGDWQD